MSFIKKHSIILSLILVLSVMIMIYSFSAQDSSKSSSESEIIVNFIIKIFFADKSIDKYEIQKYLSIIGFFIRKAAHFTEFALLGFSLSLHTNAIYGKKRFRCRYGIAVIIGILYAASDEIHQAFVPGRGPALRDVLIDSCGVLFGVLIVFLIFRHFAKKNNLQII